MITHSSLFNTSNEVELLPSQSLIVSQSNPVHSIESLTQSTLSNPTQPNLNCYLAELAQSTLSKSAQAVG